MISISKISQISKLNEKQLQFNEDNEFTQKSSLQLTVEKLEKEYQESKVNNSNNNDNDNDNSNFMMSQLINNNNAEDDDSLINTDFSNNNNNQNDEKYDNGVLLYGENEIINLPDFIESMFNEGISLTNKTINIDSWYVYGVKNPDSFYKCHVLLNYPDYILKSKREKNSFVSTYKNEMAVKLDTTYKKLLYRKFGFNRDNMIQTLLNNNQINYSIMIYLSDYNKCNVCMIDLNKQSYQIFETVVSISDFYYIIIKDGNTYIPVMNNSGNHFVSKIYLNYVIDRFEKEEIKSPNKERLISSYKIYKKEFNDNKQELIKKIKENPIIREDLENEDILVNQDECQDENNDENENDDENEDENNNNINDSNISLQIQINPNQNKNTKLIVKQKKTTSSKTTSSKDTSPKSTSPKSTSSKTTSSKATSSKDTSNNKIKSIKDYTLPQLQDLAKEFGIEIYKMGKREHMIKKLKAELYKELNSAMNS